MVRKWSIQTRLILVIIVALVLLTTALQVVQLWQANTTLVNAEEKRARALISSVNNSVQTIPSDTNTEQDFAQLEDRLRRLIVQNDDVDFIAITRVDGEVIYHSDATYKGQLVDALANLPGDTVTDRSVTDFGDVYLVSESYTSPALGLEPFYITVGIPVEPINQNLRNGVIISTVVALLAIGLVGLLTVIGLRTSITAPLERVRLGAQRFSQGDLDHQISVASGSRELNELAQTLNEMAQDLLQSRADLIDHYQKTEARFDARTRDLQMAAEIGRIATGLHDVNRLMKETVEQIRRRFDEIYHAQIFLLDSLEENAVLVESTGEVGRTLIEMGHKLPVGSESVIGLVTARGQTIMATDTLKGDVPWQPNPILPETRAEMALPLSLEGHVIGALDVQSTEPDVFTEEMVRIFEVLADQLAIAIENARLLTASERSLHEINTLNRQLTRSTWEQYFEEQGAQTALGYQFDQLQIAPIKQERAAGDHSATTIDMPVRVRGEAIGALTADLENEHQLTRDDRLLVEAVAERVALAVENARLFAQTQRALTETEQLYELARTVSGAPDLNTIYRLIAEQLSTVPNVDHIEVLLAGPEPMIVQYLEKVYGWQRQISAMRTPTRESLRVIPLSYSEYEMLPKTGPEVIAVGPDMPTGHPLWPKFNSLNTHSALIVPLMAGRRWFGILLCGSTRSSTFQQVYITFASALADQLALAIENRRLFEEAQIEARRSRALAEAGQFASQIGVDFEIGLKNLFQAVAGPGNYDRWWFGLIGDDHRTMQQTVSSHPVFPDVVQLEDDHNSLAEAAQIGEIVLVNDPTEEDTAIDPDWGKHIAIPVKLGQDVVGVMLVGRSLDETNLDERDIQLAATLASQVAIATQNQRLFAEAENQRQNLQTIVETMPTGILVLNPTGDVILSNQNLRDLLGSTTLPGMAESDQDYHIIRTGTDTPYPQIELPFSRALSEQRTVLVDDMTIQHPDGYEINVLAQAAPIIDPDGNITAVVGAFQDITELQQLERALQDSLRETTLLYEASRSISRASGLDDLLKSILWQTALTAPAMTYVFLRGMAADDDVIIQMASQPEEELDPTTLTLFAPLFVDESVIINLRNLVDFPEDLAGWIKQRGLEVFGSFPLRIRGITNGWIVIGYETMQAFTTEQRRFMTTLADQAAISIENQRLFNRTEEALHETALLYNASRVIADATTPADILDAFVESVVTRPSNYAVLYGQLEALETTSHASFEILATWGDHSLHQPVRTRYRAEQFPFIQYEPNDVIVQFHDPAQARAFEPIAEMLEALALESMIIIPLRVAERSIGGIVIGHLEAGRYSDNELRILDALADQVAITLENTRLYQQTQRRARQLGTAAEISRAVTSILHLEELLPQIVDLIQTSFEYDHVQIFLIGSAGQQAELVASTGEAGQQLLALNHQLPVGSQSVIGQVTATGEPQIALDTADARVIHRPNPLLPDTRSEMALPLIARGQILGAVDVQSNYSGAFTDEDTQILASLADMVATAIDNARLFEISEQRAEEMAFLFNVTTAATMSPELNVALSQAVQTLRRTINVSNASIYLPDETGEYMLKEAGVEDVDSEQSAIEIERGLIGWIARHHEAVVISDVTEDPRELPIDEGTQSVMAVPLVTGGDLVGVLVVESELPRAFSEYNLRLLQTLSGSLAAIIQNSRLLREVQEVNERLLEVDQLKTNFLAAMSHELRTPLNSIIGFSKVILKGIDGPLTDMQEQDLATIHESGNHLLGLVNDILDQAKLEAGKMELAFGYFKLEEVITGVMSSAIGLTRDKPIRLHTEIASDLPESYGDKFRTRQVLLNLISNASKFTNEGSITVSAFPIIEPDPVTETDQTFIQVSVTDTGIGIAEKDMPSLFEAFQQVDNSLTRAVGGTGMGLPLAKSLTELQGGRIWVESEPGVGSTFSITIPITPPPSDESAEDGAPAGSLVFASGEAKAPPEPSPKRTTILVLEDSVEVINIYRRYLARVGYEVLGVTSVSDMLNMAISINPELILLDVTADDGAGWDVLTQLQEMSSIPIIVCSMNAELDRSQDLGAVAHLVKPFSEDQLVETIEHADEVFNRQRILFVDDKPETVRPFREALELDGRYNIVDATSGEQALSIIQRPGRLDLVILDLRMPEIDGFEVLQTIRDTDQRAAVPVLVLTADEVSEDERARLQTVEVYRKDVLDEDHLINRVASELGTTRESN